jgi:LytS/YehU family sensor histidine kinase
MMTEDDNKKKIAEMQAQYDVEKRNNQIVILNEENVQRSKERNIFIGFSLLVGILLAVSIVAFINKRKANVLLTKQKQEIIDKTEIMNEQAAQIAKLQTQMNPHFIFNAINSVQRFVLKEDKNKALDYLNDFAKLMRMTLNNSDKELITLKEEKAFLTYYLKFEMLRYQDQFTYTIENDEALDEEIVELPPMLVQPYVENAIKHGLISKEEKGVLVIKFEFANIDNAERLKIVIEDNGIGRQAAADLKIGAAVEHESKGMEITANRIKAINKKYLNIYESAINIVDLHENKKATGTRVEILLPYLDNF